MTPSRSGGAVSASRCALRPKRLLPQHASLPLSRTGCGTRTIADCGPMPPMDGASSRPGSWSSSGDSASIRSDSRLAGLQVRARAGPTRQELTRSVERSRLNAGSIQIDLIPSDDREALIRGFSGGANGPPAGRGNFDIGANANRGGGDTNVGDITINISGARGPEATGSEVEDRLRQIFVGASQ